jgi:hypothetical protein
MNYGKKKISNSKEETLNCQNRLYGNNQIKKRENKLSKPHT